MDYAAAHSLGEFGDGGEGGELEVEAVAGFEGLEDPDWAGEGGREEGVGRERGGEVRGRQVRGYSLGERGGEGQGGGVVEVKEGLF